MTVVAISGFSGSGKSLNGQKLAQELGWNYIDLDTYYLPSKDKPKITLSNGVVATNYDTLKALNIRAFKRDVRRLSKDANLVVTGFALRKEVLPFKPDFHLHLLIDKKTSIARRWKSKNFAKKDPKKKEKELLMINEVAYPFYLETLSHSEIDKFFDSSQKAEEVYQQIKDYLKV